MGDSENKGDCEARESGQAWIGRVVEPVKYSRYSALDSGGRPIIIFKMEFSYEQDFAKDAINKIMIKFKHINNNQTGLKLRKDHAHGWAWRLPDTPCGRQVADMIDVALKDLCVHFEAGKGRSS